MKKTFLILIIVSMFAFALPQAAFGIGMMTEPIVIEDVLRGQELTETLSIFNAEDKEAVYELKAEGNIANWVNFYMIEDLENPITEVKVPSKSSIDAQVKFIVPEDIPNGKYLGQVVLMTVPEETEEAEQGTVSATLRLRVSRDVSITVTDKEVVKFDTSIIPLKYEVRKGEPLQIKLIYNNQGNISIEPDVQLIISKDDNTVFNVIFPYAETEEAVKPREKKTMPLIEWQTSGQVNGIYKAEVKILLDGEVIEEDDFRFAVGYTMKKFLEAVSVIGGGNIVLAWFIIGGVLIAIAVILTMIHKNPKFLKAAQNKFKNISKNVKNNH